MGLERKDRVGGRSLLMGEGTGGAVYEDIMFVDAGNDAACMSKVLAQTFMRLHLLVKFGKRAGEIADTHIPNPGSLLCWGYGNVTVLNLQETSSRERYLVLQHSAAYDVPEAQ